MTLTLRSGDVLHSLSVHGLQGAEDLVPGRGARLVVQAELPGVYHGRCAELCGMQHGRMLLLVVAETPERYAAWAARQRESAPEPADARERHGRALFVQGPCALCHTVRGTAAGAGAPDLTHLAGRSTLGAGTLKNTPANLARWISDPQQFKLGVHMPGHPLTDEDLAALVAWLGSLR